MIDNGHWYCLGDALRSRVVAEGSGACGEERFVLQFSFFLRSETFEVTNYAIRAIHSTVLFLNL